MKTIHYYGDTLIFCSFSSYVMYVTENFLFWHTSAIFQDKKSLQRFWDKLLSYILGLGAAKKNIRKKRIRTYIHWVVHKKNMYIPFLGGEVILFFIFGSKNHSLIYRLKSVLWKFRPIFPLLFKTNRFSARDTQKHADVDGHNIVEKSTENSREKRILSIRALL